MWKIFLAFNSTIVKGSVEHFISCIEKAEYKSTVSKYRVKDTLEMYENVIGGNQVTKSKDRKLVVIVDDSGMGKTAVITA